MLRFSGKSNWLFLGGRFIVRVSDGAAKEGEARLHQALAEKGSRIYSWPSMS